MILESFRIGSLKGWLSPPSRLGRTRPSSTSVTSIPKLCGRIKAALAECERRGWLGVAARERYPLASQLRKAQAHSSARGDA